MEGSINGGIPIAGWFLMDNPWSSYWQKWMIWRYPHFRKPPYGVPFQDCVTRPWNKLNRNTWGGLAPISKASTQYMRISRNEGANKNSRLGELVIPLRDTFTQQMFATACLDPSPCFQVSTRHRAQRTTSKCFPLSPLFLFCFLQLFTRLFEVNSMTFRV